MGIELFKGNLRPGAVPEGVDHVTLRHVHEGCLAWGGQLLDDPARLAETKSDFLVSARRPVPVNQGSDTSGGNARLDDIYLRSE